MGDKLCVVFPVSEGDLLLANALSRRLASMGRVDNSAVIVSSWRTKLDIGDMHLWLAQAFSSVEVIVPVFEEEGWPQGPNSMFYTVANHACYVKQVPFFFMEADIFPTKKGWLQALEAEYEIAKRPYLGVINDSRFLDSYGNRIKRGKHMVGAGIYPADFLNRCTSIHDVPETIPWDTHIGPEILQEVYDTKLICHRWGTEKYRFENDHLIMDAIDPVRYHDYAAPVSKDALLIHGCKDLSLYKLASTSDLVIP